MTTRDTPDYSIQILLLDDYESAMEITKINLENTDSSMTITTTKTPSTALTLIKNQSYDCIVSDYQMPEMNGVDFCKEVRNTSTIPFIIYTGRGSEEVASIAFVAGVDDYVRKEPELSHFKVLAKRIRHAVDKKRAEDELDRERLRFKVILESNLDGITVNTNRVLVYVNSAFSNMIGYEKSELLGKNILELHAPDYRDMVKSITEQRMLGMPAPPRYEVDLVRRDGSILHVEYSVTLIDYEGKPSSLTAIRDITERAHQGKFRRCKD